MAGQNFRGGVSNAGINMIPSGGSNQPGGINNDAGDANNNAGAAAYNPSDDQNSNDCDQESEEEDEQKNGNVIVAQYKTEGRVKAVFKFTLQNVVMFIDGVHYFVKELKANISF